MSIRAVCFDMDGVLTDTETLGAGLMTEAVGLQGFQAADSQWISLIGTSWAETCDTLKRWFPALDTQVFLADWQRLTLAWVETHGVPLRPGAAECISRLRQAGIPLALCTSNDPEVVEVYLRLAGWADAFSQVITAREVAHAKPAPDIYLEAARRLQVPPSACAGVEDSPSGLRAVRAAGMYAIMVPDQIPYTPAMAPYADAVLDSLHGLSRLLAL